MHSSLQVQLGSLTLDAELDVSPGETVALLGPNGAGKSTILRCLAGLVELDSGRIELDGVALDDPATDVFVEPQDRPVGMVFQDYLLFGHLSVIENVAYGLRARGSDRATARATAAALLERFGLSEYATEKPRSLSGGQAQRVALARAVASNPRLLLLDEPLAALDAGTRSTVRRDLRRILESFDGMRVLVTHDPVDAYALADRVVILQDGTVAQAGTLAEVTAHPRSRYVADLVGVNLVSGVISHGVLDTGTAQVVIADAADGPSFAVIRPQAISLHRNLDAAASPRNTWSGEVIDLDRMGDRVRVAIGGPLPLTAEITTAALDSLGLRPGDEIHASAKATDISAYPA